MCLSILSYCFKKLFSWALIKMIASCSQSYAKANIAESGYFVYSLALLYTEWMEEYFQLTYLSQISQHSSRLRPWPSLSGLTLTSPQRLMYIPELWPKTWNTHPIRINEISCVVPKRSTPDTMSWKHEVPPGPTHPSVDNPASFLGFGLLLLHACVSSNPT